MPAAPTIARASSQRIAARRRLGQFATPVPIARWMAGWVLEGRPRSVLDPAVGDGVLVRELMRLRARRGERGPLRLDVFDVDGAVLSEFVDGISRKGIRHRCADFVTTRLDRCFDGIIANPPYVRHHGLLYSEAVYRQYEAICGRRLRRTVNLYGLFLLKLGSLLSARGRAAVILPCEWLNAEFGAAIKAHLLESNLLDAIVQFDPTMRVFGDALTTACIVLLRRGRGPDEGVRLVGVGGAADLETMSAAGSAVFRRCDLDSNEKWSCLFDGGSQAPSAGLVLGGVASCRRGIATGANDYFTFSESARCRWRIDERDVAPCVTRARHVRGDRFTSRQWRQLRDADEPVWLLSPRPRLSAAVRRYLDEGVRRKIDRRYLPAHRPVWYRPEARPPAPILVTVFAREGFRFVRNEAGVLNLTAFHGVYPRRATGVALERLHGALCRAVAGDGIARQRRVYGGGLYKLEPRDVERLRIEWSD
jgi:adenine-specific DNA-methyltransferase